MARDTIQFKVDEVTYQITQLGMRDCGKLQLVLGRVVGSALGSLQHDATGAIASSMTSLSEADYDRVLDLVWRDAFVIDGDKRFPLLEHGDDHFAGRAGHHLEFLARAILEHLGDFIEASGRPGVQARFRALASLFGSRTGSPAGTNSSSTPSSS